MIYERDLNSLSEREIDQHFAEITERVTNTETLTDSAPPFSMNLISIIDRQKDGEVEPSDVERVIKRNGGRQIAYKATSLIRQYRSEQNFEKLSEVPMEMHAWLGGWMDSHRFFRSETRSNAQSRKVEGDQMSAREVEDIFYSSDTLGFFEDVIETFGNIIDENLRLDEDEIFFPMLVETNPENEIINDNKSFRKVRLPNGDSIIHAKRDTVVYKNDHNEYKKDPVAIFNYQFSDSFDPESIKSLISAYLQAVSIRLDIAESYHSFGKKIHVAKRDVHNVSFWFRQFSRNEKRFKSHYVDLADVMSNPYVIKAIYEYQIKIAVNFEELNKKRKILRDAAVLPFLPTGEEFEEVRLNQPRLFYSNLVSR